MRRALQAPSRRWNGIWDGEKMRIACCVLCECIECNAVWSADYCHQYSHGARFTFSFSCTIPIFFFTHISVGFQFHCLSSYHCWRCEMYNFVTNITFSCRFVACMPLCISDICRFPHISFWYIIVFWLLLLLSFCSSFTLSLFIFCTHSPYRFGNDLLNVE